MPEFAHDLGAEKAGLAYSALLAANAAGAVFGGFLLEGKGWLRPTVRTAIVSATLWCVVVTAFAFSSSYALSVALLFCAGTFNLSFYSTAQTIVQLLAPERFARSADRTVWHVDLRAAGLQRRNCRSRGRSHRGSLVACSQRNGFVCSDPSAAGIHTRPGAPASRLADMPGRESYQLMQTALRSLV